MRRLLGWVAAAVVFLNISSAGLMAQDGQCLFGGFPDETNTDCRYQVGIDIDFSYPVWVNQYDFALQTIREFLMVTRDEFWEFASMSLDTMFTPWSLQTNYEVYSFSDSVRSIVFTVTGYSGGAHPYSFFQTFTFDLAGERQILLMDLFQPGIDPLAVISPMVHADLMTQMADFGDAQWIETGTGTNPDNYQRFALTDEALIFFFDAYQVAPYAAGPFEVSLPLENIASILASEFQGVG